jgi:hypothetical protein
MSLGFFDSIKDWASKKLASTEFVTYVEQATNEQLLAPNYDMFMVLVDAANDPKGEWVADVVRSVRVRMENPNPKVKLFTLELVSVLVQNCGLKLHGEMAESKGLLSEIVELACLRQDLVRGPLAEARKTAIQLIVNLDVWFKHHPAREKTAPLASLIIEARSRNAVFENVAPDTTTIIITDKYPRRQSAAETQRSGNEILHAHAGVPAYTAATGFPAAGAGAAGRPGLSAGAAARMPPAARAPPRRAPGGDDTEYDEEVVVVEAIAVEEPDDARRSQMFDTVMLLGECFAAAQASNEAIRGNDTIAALMQQVSEDFMTVSTLVESGAVLQTADTLGALYESQRTMLRQVREATAPPASQAPAQRTATATTVAPAHQAGAVPATRPVAPPEAPQPPARTGAPTLDELFSSAAPQPVVPPAPSLPGKVAPFPVDVPTVMVGPSSAGSPTAVRRAALPEPRQSMNPAAAAAGPSSSLYVAQVMQDEELHSPKEGPDPGPSSVAATVVPAAGPSPQRGPASRTAADTEGDFDAFLNARLSVQN